MLVSSPPPSLSKTAAFFSSKFHSTEPTPSQPPHRTTHESRKLPPLARLFPSRYGTDPRKSEYDVDVNIHSLESSISPVLVSDNQSRTLLYSPTTSTLPSISTFSEHDRDDASSVASAVTSSPSSIRGLPTRSNSPKLRFEMEHERRTTLPVPQEESSGEPSESEPAVGDVLTPSGGRNGDTSSSSDVNVTLVSSIGYGAFSSVWVGKVVGGEKWTRKIGKRPSGRLVAVKMMSKSLCDVEDRTRVSFVREVEVLRFTSHPSIVTYLDSFSTPSHHVLILENIKGGELFELVNNDEQYSRISHNAVRRIWSELVSAVGWMHSVALVHRDIKLENILLTRNIFAESHPSLPPSSEPLIKLTDFGLARFIDPEKPLLTTRCGSETYAAPELIVARSGDSYGYGYDGRQTDVWACGVVLYALATRALPFDAVPAHFTPSLPSSTSTDQGLKPPQSVPRKMKRESDLRRRASGGNRRRDMFMRIAMCNYSWPEEDEEEARLVDSFVKSTVERLLIRDPAKRATMRELIAEMGGEPVRDDPALSETLSGSESVTEIVV